MHRDLKPENILIAGRRTAQVMDFVSVKPVGSDETWFGRSFLYSHPDTLESDAKVTKKSDCFSSAVILMHTLFERPYMFSTTLHKVLNQQFLTEFAHAIQKEYSRGEGTLDFLRNEMGADLFDSMTAKCAEGAPLTQAELDALDRASGPTFSNLPEHLKAFYIKLAELSKITPDSWTIGCVEEGIQEDVITSVYTFQEVGMATLLPDRLSPLPGLSRLLRTVLGTQSDCPDTNSLEEAITSRMLEIESTFSDLDQSVKSLWDTINTSYYASEGIGYDPDNPDEALDALRAKLASK